MNSFRIFTITLVILVLIAAGYLHQEGDNEDEEEHEKDNAKKNINNDEQVEDTDDGTDLSIGELELSLKLSSNATRTVDRVVGKCFLFNTGYTSVRVLDPNVRVLIYVKHSNGTALPDPYAGDGVEVYRNDDYVILNPGENLQANRRILTTKFYMYENGRYLVQARYSSGMHRNLDDDPLPAWEGYLTSNWIPLNVSGVAEEEEFRNETMKWNRTLQPEIQNSTTFLAPVSPINGSVSIQYRSPFRAAIFTDLLELRWGNNHTNSAVKMSAFRLFRNIPYWTSMRPEFITTNFGWEFSPTDYYNISESDGLTLNTGEYIPNILGVSGEYIPFLDGVSGRYLISFDNAPEEGAYLFWTGTVTDGVDFSCVVYNGE